MSNKPQNVPHETSVNTKLGQYKQLVLKANRKFSLISRNSPHQTLERLVQQSIQAAMQVPENIKHIIDIGSGAGLPGIPIALIRPELTITIVERSEKKVQFIDYAKMKLELKNIETKVEEFSPEKFKQEKRKFFTSLGVGDYQQTIRNIWPFLEEDDGCLFFINKKLASDLAEIITCKKSTWCASFKSDKVGIATFIK